MSQYSLVSSKQLIAELFTDFNVSNTDWVEKAQRHMARGLGIMKIDGFLIKKLHYACVEEFKVPLPCDAKYILAVLVRHNGCIYRLPLTTSLSLGVDFKDLALHNIYQGGIEFNYLNTNFEQGEIIFLYYALPVNDEGDLMIPSNEDVLEALPYFVIYKLSLGGYKHPVISMDMADSKWALLYPRGRNSANFPSLEQMDRLTKMRNNPLFINILDEDWVSSGSNNTVSTIELNNFIQNGQV
jgi:hypothetical protein